MKLSTKCRRGLWEEASYLVSKLRGVVDFEYFSSSFLNNNIFFYDANTDHLVAIKLVLLYFKLGMGLRVNLSESEIVLVGMGVGVDEPVAIMHCKVCSLLKNYLGMPLGSSYKEVAV